MSPVDAVAGLYHRAMLRNQRVAIYLLEPGAILTRVITVAYNDHLAMILFALDERDGILAGGETREGVLESVAHELAVDGESALGDFTFCICSFYFDVHDILFYLNIYMQKTSG